MDPEGFVETADFVEMHGVRIHKPFVEKPVSGDNHNINIYYPQQKALHLSYDFAVKGLMGLREGRRREMSVS